MKQITIALGVLILGWGLWIVFNTVLNQEGIILLAGRLAVVLFGIILIVWGAKTKQQ